MKEESNGLFTNFRLYIYCCWKFGFGGSKIRVCFVGFDKWCRRALGSELGGIGEYAFGSFGLTVVSILIFLPVYHFFSFSWFDFFERVGKVTERTFLERTLAGTTG